MSSPNFEPCTGAAARMTAPRTRSDLKHRLASASSACVPISRVQIKFGDALSFPRVHLREKPLGHDGERKLECQ